MIIALDGILYDTFVPYDSCSASLNSVAYQGAVCWNSLHLNIICLQSFTKFKKSIHLMISEKYLF